MQDTAWTVLPQCINLPCKPQGMSISVTLLFKQTVRCTHLQHKLLVKKLLGNGCLKVWTFQEPQEELVHKL